MPLKPFSLANASVWPTPTCAPLAPNAATAWGAENAEYKSSTVFAPRMLSIIVVRASGVRPPVAVASPIAD